MKLYRTLALASLMAVGAVGGSFAGNTAKTAKTATKAAAVQYECTMCQVKCLPRKPKPGIEVPGLRHEADRGQEGGHEPREDQESLNQLRTAAQEGRWGPPGALLAGADDQPKGR